MAGKILNCWLLTRFSCRRWCNFFLFFWAINQQTHLTRPYFQTTMSMSSQISTGMVMHSEPTNLTDSNDTSMSQIGVLQSRWHFIRIIKYNFYCGPLSAPLAECGMFPRLPRPGRTSKCQQVQIRRNKRAQWTHKNSVGYSRRWSLHSTSLECRVSYFALSKWFESEAWQQL